MQGQRRRDHTEARQHTCEEGSLRVFVIFAVFLFGLEITGSSGVRVFCFKSSCPIGSLGGRAGTTAHCAAGPASSHFFVLFGRDLQPSCLFVGFLLTNTQ